MTSRATLASIASVAVRIATAAVRPRAVTRTSIRRRSPGSSRRSRSGHLLAQPQRGDDIGLWAVRRLRRAVIKAREHERAVAWNVVASGSFQRLSCCVPVHVACLRISCGTGAASYQARSLFGGGGVGTSRLGERLLDLGKHEESTAQPSGLDSGEPAFQLLVDYP